MSAATRRALLVLALLGAIASPGCTRRSVPIQDDAVTQYFYARDQFYVPAMQDDGDQRERLLRLAVDAFQTVVRRFPDDRSATTRALAEYYTGLCQTSLGELQRARDAFLRCQDYRRFVNRRGAEAMHPAGRATLIAIMDRAREQIRRIDRVRPR